MARIELFLVWESNCRGILNDLQVLPAKLLDEIKVRIFLRKDTPLECRPPSAAKWIELYQSFTTAPYASDTTLMVFCTKYFKDLAFFNQEHGETESSCDPVRFYFIVDCESERKFDELIAILDLDCKSKVSMKAVNGEQCDISNVLGLNFCRACNEVFQDEQDLKEHNTDLHNYFCANQDCSRSKQHFYNEQDLADHVKQQTLCDLCHDSPIFCSEDAKVLHMRLVHNVIPQTATDYSKCDFCPTKAFSSPEQKETHMRILHKKCNCGCAEYFKNRNGYLEHFYSVYPLACLENRKCPYRFQTVLHQAEHHKNTHNSESPYYCALCCAQSGAQSRTGRVAVKDASALKHHGTLMGHTLEEMFLIKETSSKAMAKSSAINYC